MDFLDVPVFFGTIADVFQSEEGQFDHDGRDGGRPSRPKHAEEWELNLIPRAEDATSGLEHQAERENDPGSSSEEVQEEALDDSIVCSYRISSEAFSSMRFVVVVCKLTEF